MQLRIGIGSGEDSGVTADADSAFYPTAVDAAIFPTAAVSTETADSSLQVLYEYCLFHLNNKIIVT
jgi:hypothetical protein